MTDELNYGTTGLVEEQVPFDVDFDAPEPGSFPPAFEPSTRDFLFTLVEPSEQVQPFEVVEIQGKQWLQVNYIATVEVDGKEVKIPFQRASAFKTEKMRNSRLADLIRSLKLREEYQAAVQQTGSPIEAVKLVLAEASGRKLGTADFGWSAAFKDSKVIYRTGLTKVIAPKKEDGYTSMPWPRNGNGGYAASVTDPQSGQEKYGRLEVVRLRIGK